MTAPPAWNLSAACPIALLPVRLETRWLGTVLAIRIIPDTVHLDSFEAELTAAEVAAGQFYWSQAAGENGPAAWQQLADRFSAPRAAWIARSTRTASPAAGRSASWTRTPQALALPSRWTAVAQTGAETVRATGLPVPPGPLPAGPDPNSGALPDWMLGFDAALAVGMGIRLPLSPAMLNQRRVDRLLVYGVAETTNPATGAGVLADLLDRHYYTDGLSYLAPGTRTNNTDTQAAEYAPGSADYRASYRVPATDPAPAGVDSAAGRLSRLLGLPATADRALNLATGATATEERTARAMNEALWAATWGYFLSQLLVADSGEEARRPDHSNVIADDAYLRSLDRQRLWPTAQRGVIAGVLGHDPGDPGTSGFADAWQQAIAQVAAKQKITPEAAAAQLSSQADAALTQLWHQRTGDYGSPQDDWRVAAAALQHDRAARFAYFRWLDRVSRGGPAQDTRLADWLAGETAAKYGDATVLAARDHFADHVRPGGHLPSVLIGRQPYGILLTTALDRWQPDGHEAGLRPVVAALRALRDTVWLPAANALPRLGAQEYDVDTANRALLDIMGTAPVSPEVFGRVQLGPDYLRNLWRFAQPGLRPDWEAVAADSSRQLLHDVGIAWRPRVAGLVGAEFPSLLTAPRVTASGTPTTGWLNQLADPATALATLTGQPDLPGSSTPLLYRLLRHSLLREYADAAIRLQAGRHQLADWQHLDPELVGIRPGDVGQTVWSAIETTLIGTGSGAVSLSKYLQTGQAGSAGAGIDRFRGAVRTLAEAEDALLDRHLRQTLDATSHRLDAWISSIAARRLASQRTGQPTGLLLGGYGWLTDLRAADAAAPDVGFVHAPSVPQAVTAAVLRSGYDSHAGGAANPFAINLGSARVRAADELLSVIRAGQPPGLALGYLFERRLQQTVAGSYLQQFRAIAPAPARTVTADGTLAAGQLPAGTVDGLVLAEKLSAGAADLQALLDRIRADDGSRPATPLLPTVTAALAGLHEIVDATADALLADAVHHAVNGAPSRAAATLDALAAGEGSVPELAALRTPPSGTALTHRVALLLAADVPAVPGWPAGSPRAAASPELELLLQRLLPEPASVLVPASVEVPGADPVAVTVSLADAGLSALDCVLATGPAPAPDGTDEPAELLSVALARAARTRAEVAGRPPVRLAPTSEGGGPGLAELIRLCRLLADLVRRSRPLADTDLAPAGSTGAGPADLASRGDRAVAVLAEAQQQLSATDDTSQRNGLWLAGQLGVPGAATAADADAVDPGALAAVAAELAARQRAVGQWQPAAGQSARIQAALGADLPVLAPVHPIDPAELATARAAASRPGFAPPASIRRWLATLSAVREPVASLSRLLAGRLALRLPGLPPATAQFPVVTDPSGQPTEPWLGADFGDRQLGGPRTQLTFLQAAPVPDGAPVAGLLIDEWSELVPSRTAITGLAYRYPTPTNQPGQAVLVAVSPDPAASHWDPPTLEAILAETLQLAAVRAVDPDALTSTGQLLPAAYLAFNPGDAHVPSGPPDTVSTRLIEPS